jgi:sterol desaturase/sphingolipid hydroxylase (fatty acid hydroxylase superfamily)
MSGNAESSQRLRLFRSDRLERLTVIRPRAFAVIWTALLLLILWAGWAAVPLAYWLGLVLIGLVTWSLFEYCMHRFLFHLELRSDLGRRLGFVIHGNHHQDPNDPYRSLMPPIVSITWSGMIWAMFVALFGSAGTVLFLGFELGYVTYDSIHYACHQRPMRGRFMRALRQHHLRHHFGRSRGNYAITTIFWDHLFGSYVPAKLPSTNRSASS